MIIKIKKTRDYTVMCNAALDDDRLSLKAKGLYAVLMSKPVTWTISYRGLQQQLKEGQTAILSALKELEKAGYLRRVRTRDADGKVRTYNELREFPKTVRGKSMHGKPTQLVNTEQVSTHLGGVDKLKDFAIARRALVSGMTR